MNHTKDGSNQTDQTKPTEKDTRSASSYVGKVRIIDTIHRYIRFFSVTNMGRV